MGWLRVEVDVDKNRDFIPNAALMCVDQVLSPPSPYPPVFNPRNEPTCHISPALQFVHSTLREGKITN